MVDLPFGTDGCDEVSTVLVFVCADVDVVIEL